MTPREVAEQLGVTVRTVQRWVTDGRLAAVRVGGRVRIAPEALNAMSQPGNPRGALAGQAAPTRPIRAVLIANRGEVVGRVERTAHRLGMRVIGIQAPDDAAPRGVNLVLPVPAYLDGAAIIDAARRSGADAIHPGYGFLAESAAFADAVLAAGLVWVGPPPAAMSALGGKAAARREAAARGVPVLPGYDDSAQDDASLARAAAGIGLPLLVKPAAGGGGKGMRAVREATQLVEALASARREALAAFGDDRLILERMLIGARHVEVQVLFDRHGRGIHLGERDCSSQRRNQKIVEESPAPSVSNALRVRLGEAALAVAGAVGYVGAGTVEFLLTDAGEFFFLEMNTRLQVEHPVTEAVTGRDLVEDQLRIAAGEPLVVGPGAPIGHAIQARVYAEDPDAGYLPAAGRLARVRWPSGVRIDTGVAEGDTISDRYDPLLAKLIAHGPTRAAALSTLGDALRHTQLLGVRTNLRFLRWLTEQPVMVDAEMRIDTLASLSLPAPPVADATAWSRAAAALLAAGLGGSWTGGWRAAAPAAVRLRLGDEERRVEPMHEGGGAVAVLDGTAFVDIEGQSVELSVALPPSVDEAARQAAAHAGVSASLTSPMPGRVIAVRAQIGDPLRAHQAVVVIEAMKMEHAVMTPLAGKLAAVHVVIGQQVRRGDLLAEVSA